MNRRHFLKKTTAAGLTAYAAGVKGSSAFAKKTVSAKENKELEEDNLWSLVILPDTQLYSLKYPGLLHLQTQWLFENKNKYNIVYVLQNGDVTHNNTELEWKRASKAFSRLDGEIPYAISLGNHDYEDNATNRTTLANKYLPISRFAEWQSFGQAMEKGKINNVYHTFKAANQDYMIICLEFGPRNEVLEWANNIIENHPNHKVILMTHAYLYSDSTRYDWKGKRGQQKWNPHSYPLADTGTTINDGQQMWDKMVSKYSNIFLTINGHVLNDGLGFSTSTADNGNKVHQMLVNYQMLPVGGGGWLRILKFLPYEKKIKVEDYSPLYETVNSNSKNQFIIDLDF